MNWIEYMVSITEILGTVAFSVSGAMTAIRKKMDILGVVVLGVVTAVGGGIIRDLLLGITPPAAFQNPVYVAWATVTALLAFVLARHTWSEKNRHLFELLLNLVDSLGLGLFAVIGVRTAIDCGYGENGFLSIFVGVLTGVGGGIPWPGRCRRFFGNESMPWRLWREPWCIIIPQTGSSALSAHCGQRHSWWW